MQQIARPNLVCAISWFQAPCATTSWAARTTVSKHAWLRPRCQQPQAQLTAQWSSTGGQAREQTAAKTGTYRLCAAEQGKLELPMDLSGGGAGCLLCGQVGHGHQLAHWHAGTGPVAGAAVWSGWLLRRSTATGAALVSAPILGGPTARGRVACDGCYGWC